MHKAILMKLSQEQGFSMIEVLISVLVTILFLAGTLQLMGISTLYKVLAKQEANANLWIQSDIEEVQALAGEIPANEAFCNPATINDPNNSTSNTLPVNSYATALREQIEASTTLPGSTNKPLLSSRSGKLYNMKRTFAAVTTANPNRLDVSYEVIDIQAAAGTDQDINKSNYSQGGVIATGSISVIVPASFDCD